MKALITLIFGILLLVPQDKEMPKAVGDWRGALEVPGGKLNLVFHVKYEDEKFSATMDSPDQGAFGLKMDEVSFEENVLKMTMNQIQGSYEGTFKDGKFEGKWSQGGQSIELNLSKIKKGTS